MLAKIINNEVTGHNFLMGSQVVLYDVVGVLDGGDKLWLCLGPCPDEVETIAPQIIAESELKIIGGRAND